MSWRWLFRYAVMRARSLAVDKAGSNSAARIAMIAMTTSSSTSVKPQLDCREGDSGSLRSRSPPRKVHVWR